MTECVAAGVQRLINAMHHNKLVICANGEPMILNRESSRRKARPNHTSDSNLHAEQCATKSERSSLTWELGLV